MDDSSHGNDSWQELNRTSWLSPHLDGDHLRDEINARLLPLRLYVDATILLLKRLSGGFHGPNFIDELLAVCQSQDFCKSGNATMP